MPIPRTEKLLYAWLRDTLAGRAIIEGIVRAACLACERVRDFETRCLGCEKRRKVLVICGWSETDMATVDVYADKAVDVHCAQRLCTGFREGDLLAGEYLEKNLPHVYCELHVPGNLRSGETWRRQMPEDEIWRKINLGILRIVQTLPEHIRPSVAREP